MIRHMSSQHLAVQSPSDANALSVISAIQKYADTGNPSAFLALNSGNSYFRLPADDGLIVYRPVGRYMIQFGGPFAAPSARPALLRAFMDYAARRGKEIVAVQLQSADAEPYLQAGFVINQMGASYAVDLNEFSLKGTRFMQLRNKISRALRSGLEIVEAPYDDWREAIAKVDAAWLQAKGEDVKALEFLVGETGGPHQDLRRLFIAVRDGSLVGYISYSPVYGPQPGWMHDLSRRHPDAGPGVMEAINKAAIDIFKDEAVRWLHFGFTPFTSLNAPQFPGHSLAFHWFMNYLWEQGAEIYPAQTQLSYKEKWAPTLILPEYVAFQGRASLPGLVHIFRACNAV